MRSWNLLCKSKDNNSSQSYWVVSNQEHWVWFGKKKRIWFKQQREEWSFKIGWGKQRWKAQHGREWQKKTKPWSFTSTTHLNRLRRDSFCSITEQKMQSLSVTRSREETESVKGKSWLAKAATFRPHAFFSYLADTFAPATTVKLFLLLVRYVNPQRKQPWRYFWSSKKKITKQTGMKRKRQVKDFLSYFIFSFFFFGEKSTHIVDIPYCHYVALFLFLFLSFYFIFFFLGLCNRIFGTTNGPNIWNRNDEVDSTAAYSERIFLHFPPLGSLFVARFRWISRGGFDESLFFLFLCVFALLLTASRNLY